MLVTNRLYQPNGHPDGPPLIDIAAMQRLLRCASVSPSRGRVGGSGILRPGRAGEYPRVGRRTTGWRPAGERCAAWCGTSVEICSMQSVLTLSGCPHKPPCLQIFYRTPLYRVHHVAFALVYLAMSLYTLVLLVLTAAYYSQDAADRICTHRIDVRCDGSQSAQRATYISVHISVALPRNVASSR